MELSDEQKKIIARQEERNRKRFERAKKRKNIKLTMPKSVENWLEKKGEWTLIGEGGGSSGEASVEPPKVEQLFSENIFGVYDASHFFRTRRFTFDINDVFLNFGSDFMLLGKAYSNREYALEKYREITARLEEYANVKGCYIDINESLFFGWTFQYYEINESNPEFSDVELL